ncbi:MAG: S1/P1 nuclease [Acidobacteriota bacterium]
MNEIPRISRRRSPNPQTLLRRMGLGSLSAMLLGAALCVALASPVAAWHDTGHMITAQIAYDELTDHARAEVDGLIAILAEEPPHRDHAVTASVWADDLKRQGVRIYDHWHYINLPVFGEGLVAHPEPEPRNVVWAIEQAVLILRGDASDHQKASMLGFLLHFVGDVHQPMHCASRYTRELPTGDRGGNELKLDHEWSNLHLFWDDAAGLFPDFDERQWQPNIRRFADDVVRLVPKTSVPQWRRGDARAWAWESHGVAVEAAYAGIEDGAKPSPEYVARAREVARQRLAIGGYRLGALLNDIFGGVAPNPGRDEPERDRKR